MASQHSLENARDLRTRHSQASPGEERPAKVSDYPIARLRHWGISRIYGYSGGHAALFTGEIGGCLATQGRGAIHSLNGLYVHLRR